jgi:hypothetical protein
MSDALRMDCAKSVSRVRYSRAPRHAPGPIPHAGPSA